MQNRLESQGLSQSGAEQKALEQFGQQGTAGQQQQFLSNVLGARQQTVGGLQGLSGLGLGAASTSGQLGLQGQQDISQLLQSLGMTGFNKEQADAARTSGMLGSFEKMFTGV